MNFKNQLTILIADGFSINSNQRFNLTSQEEPCGYGMLPQGYTCFHVKSAFVRDAPISSSSTMKASTVKITFQVDQVNLCLATFKNKTSKSTHVTVIFPRSQFCLFHAFSRRPILVYSVLIGYERCKLTTCQQQREIKKERQAFRKTHRFSKHECVYNKIALFYQ